MKAEGDGHMTSVEGITHLHSSRSVSDVLARLLSLLESKGITLFGVIDHSGEALKAGIKMPDTKLAIFGNPNSGTPLMLAAPDCALDLPLKILIAEAADETTCVSYNSPVYLQRRYGLMPDLVAKIAAIDQIAAAIVA
jgi:uncharacterized protein (DUF302 family)